MRHVLRATLPLALSAAAWCQEMGPPPQLSGPELFHERGCVQCHTIHGAGGNKGPDLSRVGKRLTKVEIEHQILKGGQMMPPFEEALTPEEAKRLVEYLHKLR